MRGLRTAIAVGLVALLAAGLVTTASSAGDDGSGATAAAGKKKKKKCPAGTTKKVVTKKNGKKKVTCVAVPVQTPVPVTPAPPAASLAVSPTSFTFPTAQSGGECFTVADPDCPDQVFTVTNTGATSVNPAASISMVLNGDNDPGSRPGFKIIPAANGCTASMAAGTSCSVTVTFSPEDDGAFTGSLRITGTPGGSAQASLTAEGN